MRFAGVASRRTCYHREPADLSTYLGPVGDVPPRLACRSLTLLLGDGLVVGQTVVLADDRQDRAEFLHTDHVTLDHSVTARHRTLHRQPSHRPSI